MRHLKGGIACAQADELDILRFQQPFRCSQDQVCALLEIQASNEADDWNLQHQESLVQEGWLSTLRHHHSCTKTMSRIDVSQD